MRYLTVGLFVLSLLASSCGSDKKPQTPAGPAAPGSRGPGEDCVQPGDCQEGLWCLNGRCKEPLDRGMQKKQEMEALQDEHYEQLDDKVRAIEEKLRE
jgi:hypothetical protein